MDDTLIHDAKAAEVGGFRVRRALPRRGLRTVGAWCFADHMGPEVVTETSGLDVGPHPHIGLQTFTWLIEGEVMHQDSLGNAQLIRPGQVNLMTAGRGIVHTEDSLRDGARLHAAQLWIALPPGLVDCPPAFEHHPTLPRWQEGDTRLTLLAGRYGGQTAPTRVHSPLLGLDLESVGASRLTLTLEPGFEYGLLPLVGSVGIEGEVFQADEFAYLGTGRSALQIELAAGARALLLGGEPFAEPVLMWWNFVGFSKAAIAEAQRQWEHGDARFGEVGDGRAERLMPPPLPWRLDE